MAERFGLFVLRCREHSTHLLELSGRSELEHIEQRDRENTAYLVLNSREAFRWIRTGGRNLTSRKVKVEPTPPIEPKEPDLI